MHRKFSHVAAGLMAILMLVTTAAAPMGIQQNGFLTAQLSMLDPVMPGVQITPLLTVGDVLQSGFRFEAIPDGISVYSKDKDKKSVDIFVNHETSKVPFPYNPSVATTDPGESQNDFDNAQVSQITLDTQTMAVLNGSFAIKSSAGFQRFCSNYLATSKEGFDRDILFTNEEAIDYVFRQEASWPPPIGDPNEKQIGLVVALDVKNGKYHPIYGMGRHNHENSVPIPGYEDLVVLSGDDTFTSGPLTIPPGGPNTATSAPAQSQVYSYIAPNTKDLLDDKGDLWAFVSDTPGFNDYYDFTPGSTQSINGHFVKVPKNIATGLDTDGSELKAADVGYPLPPTDGSWQRDNRTTTAVGYDGPQWVLEYWSQLNDVFRFVRVEDIAYDKRPGMQNVVYVVDSGRGTAGAPQANRSTNGRVWKMVFDLSDPTKVTSLSVFVEGDDSPVKTLTEVHQPDNIESTPNGILLTEDPGSAQQFPVNSTDPNTTTARLMWVPFVGLGAAGPSVTVVKVNQSADEGPTDVDPPDNPPFAPAAFPISPGNLGAWETSGIVDASAAFGSGWFLINVQAHTLWVDKAVGFDTFVDTNSDPDFTFKREGGQLLLIYIPNTGT